MGLEIIILITIIYIVIGVMFVIKNSFIFFLPIGIGIEIALIAIRIATTDPIFKEVWFLITLYNVAIGYVLFRSNFLSGSNKW